MSRAHLMGFIDETLNFEPMGVKMKLHGDPRVFAFVHAQNSHVGYYKKGNQTILGQAMRITSRLKFEELSTHTSLDKIKAIAIYTCTNTCPLTGVVRT